MNLKIVPVTKENRSEAEKLSVFPEQKNFIETVSQCMSEADELAIWHPVCIYDEEIMIGFAMCGYFKNEGNGKLWLDRFLIDRHYQHRGYGKKAFGLILNGLKKGYPGENIYLSVYDDNFPAIHMYQEYGFRFNGELDFHGEKVMVCEP